MAAFEVLLLLFFNFLINLIPLFLQLLLSFLKFNRFFIVTFLSDDHLLVMEILNIDRADRLSLNHGADCVACLIRRLNIAQVGPRVTG